MHINRISPSSRHQCLLGKDVPEATLNYNLKFSPLALWTRHRPLYLKQTTGFHSII